MRESLTVFGSTGKETERTYLGVEVTRGLPKPNRGFNSRRYMLVRDQPPSLEQSNAAVHGRGHDCNE